MKDEEALIFFGKSPCFSKESREGGGLRWVVECEGVGGVQPVDCLLCSLEIKSVSAIDACECRLSAIAACTLG